MTPSSGVRRALVALLLSFSLSAACGISKRAVAPALDAGGSPRDALSPAMTDALPDVLGDAVVDEANATADAPTVDAPPAAGGAGGTGPPSYPGEPCLDAADCVSGFCVGGVCCNTSCSGPCRSCTVGGTVGRCTLLAAGATPPDPTSCPASSPRTCGFDGRCDGKGACRQYGAGTLCAPSTCVDSVLFQGESFCDGLGLCLPPAPIVCYPYECQRDVGRCRVGCINDAACVAPARCLYAQCSVFRDEPCALASDCPSGFCAQGVCCDSACAGPCRACNSPGSIGVCISLPAGVTDPQGYCATQDASTCGTTGRCDGQGGCARYAEGASCGTGRACQAGMCQTIPDIGP